MKRRRLFIYIIAVVILLPIIGFRFYLYPRLPILNGHAAKNMCSCIFLAGSSESLVKKQELGFFPVNLATIKIDQEKKSVTASVWGFRPKTAYYREGLGCALFNQKTPSQQERLLLHTTPVDSLVNWFEHQAKGKTPVVTPQQQAKLEKAIDWAFRQANPQKLFTRATLVIYKGRLVAERYAKGFDKNSHFMGWSMTKGVTVLLYGILAKQGKITLDQPVNLPAWKGTPKEEVTYRHLLNMQSGLQWVEDYGNVSDVTKMLYQSDALGKMASKVSSEFTPGTEWKYSSGTSNLLAYVLASYFPNQKSYQEFPYKALLHRIGAYSMVLETDAEGYFVGSSYSWATARDWAKLGMLVLNNGAWNGEQIIDKSFVDFIRKPLPKSKGHYGAGFWLNATSNPKKYMPDVPKDAYSYRGFHGQRVEIIPSRDLVLVRLGETHKESAFSFNEWTKKVLEALN